MVEQISSENTKRILLEGTKQGGNPRVVVSKKNRKNEEVIVENSTEKRYLWTARAFAIIFAVSLCCNLILIYVIFSVIPLYRIEPYLFSFADKEEQIYRIEPVRNIREYKNLTELFIREYVLLRNTFVEDTDEMKRRWGEGSAMQEMSSPKVYKDFKDNIADRAIEQINTYSLSRNIKILSVAEVGGANGATWWQVEFRLEDMTPELEVPKVEVWVASIQIIYRAKRVTFNERLKNPLGFTVVSYKVTKRKTD